MAYNGNYGLEQNVIVVYYYVIKFVILATHTGIKNVDGAMHFIYSHKYNTNSAEDSSDMN